MIDDTQLVFAHQRMQQSLELFLERREGERMSLTSVLDKIAMKQTVRQEATIADLEQRKRAIRHQILVP